MKDNLETVVCPACGKEMKKVYSPESKIYVDICIDGCGGMYFDNFELKKFDEKNENIDFILDVIKDKTFEKTNEKLQRTCPNCFMKMVKNYTDSSKEVEIDTCYGCGGVFLDHGELEKIRKQFETEKERKEDFGEKFQNIYSEELMAVQKEAMIAEKNRSFVYQMFRKIYDRHI